MKMAGSTDPYVRGLAAKGPATPAGTLSELAKERGRAPCRGAEPRRPPRGAVCRFVEVSTGREVQVFIGKELGCGPDGREVSGFLSSCGFTGVTMPTHFMHGGGKKTRTGRGTTWCSGTTTCG